MRATELWECVTSLVRLRLPDVPSLHSHAQGPLQDQDWPCSTVLAYIHCYLVTGIASMQASILALAH